MVSGEETDPCQSILHRQLGKVDQFKLRGIGFETVAKHLLAINIVGRCPGYQRNRLCVWFHPKGSIYHSGYVVPYNTPVTKLRDGDRSRFSA